MTGVSDANVPAAVGGDRQPISRRSENRNPHGGRCPRTGVNRYRIVLLFLLLAILWGTAFPAITAGLSYIPPVLFAAIRYDIAGLLMLAYAGYVGERLLPRTRGEVALIGIGGVMLIAGYHAFLFVGQSHTTSATAAVIVALAPVLTTAFARMLLPTGGLSWGGIAGMMFGFSGVVVLARPSRSDLLGSDTLAATLIFVAAFSFALGSVLTRLIDDELPIETMEAWSMLLGAVLLHLLSAALPGESFRSIEWTGEAIFALAYLAVGASAIGFLLYFALLSALGPVEINLVSYVVPVVATVIGWLWLGEPLLDPPTIAGFALIATGFVLIKRRAITAELPAVRRAISRP